MLLSHSGTVPKWLITVFVDFHSSFLIHFDIRSVICTSCSFAHSRFPRASPHRPKSVRIATHDMITSIYSCALSHRRYRMRWKCIRNCRVSHKPKWKTNSQKRNGTREQRRKKQHWRFVHRASCTMRRGKSNLSWMNGIRGTLTNRRISPECLINIFQLELFVWFNELASSFKNY